MAVLVTGGAGYIGSHMAWALLDAGEQTVVLDNLSTGYEGLIPPQAVKILGDVGDTDLVEGVIADHGITAVIHFAGFIRVNESVREPLKYYRSNLTNSFNLIETCIKGGVKKFILSSTASVYGEPERTPVAEDVRLKPITPYGASKAMVERILEDVARTCDLSYACLRYFNVAGADPKLRSGQVGKPTHLIKIAAQVAAGLRDDMQIFGYDYPTADGTCIRDYVHVSDLVGAHMAALRRLDADGGRPLVLNCGYGRGFSVREVIAAVERVTGRAMNVDAAPRREGDPPQLVADTAAIRSRLDWTPQYDDLDFIVRTAIEWEEKLASLEGAAA
ncbi:MAG: UDP-glucose 4-epimerase GalE [Pseudomonadota bacterium]